MGNIISTLRYFFCPCFRCKCCGLTREEKIQAEYDKIRSDDIYDSQV